MLEIRILPGSATQVQREAENTLTLSTDYLPV